MSLLQVVRKTLGILGLFVVAPAFVSAQTTSYVPQGGEFSPTGPMLGDQVMPALALNANGGFLVFQDNVTDGNGLGISAIKLNSSFSSPLGAFRVNSQGTNDQENPGVALLQNGGAVFVWQSGVLSFQHIYARFLSSSNTFTTGDIQVNTSTNHYQANPAVATLANGNVIVVWSSFGQDNADGFQGVYGQILTPAGSKVGSEFLINQFTPFNQRSPALAAFPNGNFIVTWVSEEERFSAVVSSNALSSASPNSVDIYARIFSGTGASVTGEFLVNTGSSVCANPTVAVAPDNSFMIAWGQKDLVVTNNSWDIFARPFSSAEVGGNVVLANTQQYGDQFAPKISSVGTEYMLVWTSLGQDGSREGVFGQFLLGDGTHDGDEFRVNTTTLNSQKYQTVASDGAGRFLVVWSSFVGGVDSADLYAQAYVNSNQQPLSAPGAPMVTAPDEFTLTVTWPPVTSFNVAYYDLYVDGSTTPIAVSNIMWSETYNPATTHSFKIAYVLTNGMVSPLSAPGSGTTWGIDANHDGLPDNWQSLYWGTNSAKWPGPNTLLAPGVSVLQVFLWGANPLQPGTWLKQWLNQTSQGWYLNWNTIPGGIYQVRASTDMVHWSNLGAPRYAAGNTDSVYLGLANRGYYQIVHYIY